MFLHATKLFGSSSSTWGIRKSVTTQMSSRTKNCWKIFDALYIAGESWQFIVFGMKFLKSCYFEMGGWKTFELWSLSIWRLSFGSSKYLKTGVLPPKTLLLLHLTHVLQCHCCCNLFDFTSDWMWTSFHRVFFRGKIIAPKAATATGAGALGCQTWQWKGDTPNTEMMG